MIKQQSSSEAPIYKKIQNYIFKFSDLLGQGNFSKVYRAHHELTSQIVAIKIVELESLKSKKLEQLLFSQIDVLKKLNHPNVLKCYEVFTSNRNCYIITQLCNEGDLESKLRKQKYFDEKTAEPIIRDIFQGLSYLGEKNVIHRDLKVANVFLHKSKAKIADFGFAKFTKQKFKDINIGSPIYMSPQGFISNIYGPKTDVWAFGILIYELLHGETPFSTCRTENQLKQSLSIPISKNKFKNQLSHEVREVISSCLQVDETKRISISQLAKTPYFRRILGKTISEVPLLINPTSPSSTLELRFRSPSYNGENKILKSQQLKPLQVENNQEPYTNPVRQHLNINNTNSIEKNQSMQYPLVSKRLIELQAQETVRNKRAVSTEKTHLIIPMRKQSQKNQKGSIQKTMKREPNNRYLIIAGSVSFKQCVNILHYGRLIFKFLLTLKVSQYSNDNQLFRLSKWLMNLLKEINDKIQQKLVNYDGDNYSLRQQKLKQVRGQYQKKYKSELANYIRPHSNYGEQTYTLDYVKNYCYTLYQKYDGLISKQHNKSLIMLGHCIVMMCDSIKILKKCYIQSNYSYFTNCKQIQTFLNTPKSQIDLNSYLNYRKKMVMYQ